MKIVPWPTEVEKKAMGFEKYFKLFYRLEIAQYRKTQRILKSIKTKALVTYNVFYGEYADA